MSTFFSIPGRRKLNLGNLAFLIKQRLLGLDHRMYIKRTRLHQHPWTIPVIDGMGYDLAMGYESEPWLFRAMLSQYQQTPFSVFIDIGVNVGHTLLKVKSIDSSIAYFGFEPNPACVYYAEFLTRLNHIKHVSLSCFGLGALISMQKLHFRGQEDTRATVRLSQTTPTDLIYNRQIIVWKLDKTALPIQPGDNVAIKIDVEGYELDVLQGAIHFIQRFQPVVFFECLPHNGYHEQRERSQHLFSWFWERGYSLYLLQQDGQKQIVNRDFDNRNDFTLTDFMALPATAT